MHSHASDRMNELDLFSWCCIILVLFLWLTFVTSGSPKDTVGVINDAGTTAARPASCMTDHDRTAMMVQNMYDEHLLNDIEYYSFFDPHKAEQLKLEKKERLSRKHCWEMKSAVALRELPPFFLSPSVFKYEVERQRRLGMIPADLEFQSDRQDAVLDPVAVETALASPVALAPLPDLVVVEAAPASPAAPSPLPTIDLATLSAGSGVPIREDGPEMAAVGSGDFRRTPVINLPHGPASISHWPFDPTLMLREMAASGAGNTGLAGGSVNAVVEAETPTVRRLPPPQLQQHYLSDGGEGAPVHGGALPPPIQLPAAASSARPSGGNLRVRVKGPRLLSSIPRSIKFVTQASKSVKKRSPEPATKPPAAAECILGSPPSKSAKKRSLEPDIEPPAAAECILGSPPSKSSKKRSLEPDIEPPAAAESILGSSPSPPLENVAKKTRHSAAAPPPSQTTNPLLLDPTNAHEVMKQWITDFNVRFRHFPASATEQHFESPKWREFCLELYTKFGQMHEFASDDSGAWDGARLPQSKLKGIGIREGEYLSQMKRKLKGGSARLGGLGCFAEAFRAFSDFDDLFEDAFGLEGSALDVIY